MLLIDVRQIRLHHYFITEKFVVVKFNKELIDNAAFKIKTIKFIRDIVYENGESIKELVKQIHFWFEQQALNKMRQIYFLSEGKITKIDLIRILKEAKQNQSEWEVAKKYKDKYQELTLGLIEHIVQNCKKFNGQFD